ncbi:retrovirus-related pol polyprotein from transposon TNT 1-94 [Tanacetum coccineum]
MLRVFPITLTGAAKRWVDRLSLGTVDSWDILTKSFIQRSINNNNSNTKGIAAIESKLDSLGASLKNLETQIKQLAKEFYAKTVSEVNNSSIDQCKAVYDDEEAPFSNEINEPHEVYFVSADHTHVVQEEELGASINVIPKSMFEHLKLARLKKTDMLVEMADMTKRALIGIVENVLIKTDKFLFPLDFVVIDILKTRNETIILGTPFLATIHAEIDVFNKEISLGIGDDKVTFDMNMKVNNFSTLVGIIYMINDEPYSSNDTPTDESYRYEETQGNDLIWYKRYAEWCYENSSPDTPTLKFTSIQEDYKPRPKDYPFKDWLLTKVGHTDVSEPVKRDLLKTWLIDCFQAELVKDPRSRSFDDYKWMFKLEIDQLTEEYVLGIGKKGHMIDDICEN